MIFGHQKCIPAEEGGDRAADHDVVKMRDDEIGVGDWISIGTDARNSPVRPPMVNRPRKPNAYSIGASNAICRDRASRSS